MKITNKILLISLFSLLFGALLSMGGRAARAEEQEGFWSTSDYFYWIASVDKTAGDLSILVNGKTIDGKKSHVHFIEDSAHARILLEPEMNTIEIRQGETVLFSGAFFYAPSYNDLIVPEDMPMYLFHSEEKEEKCKGCHRMEVNDADRTPQKPQDSACYVCHKEEFEGKKSKHKPVVPEWKCLSCHSAEFSESDLLPDAVVRYQVAEINEIAQLCYACHKEQERLFGDYEYQHGPVGEGACLFCHNPHGSSQPKLVQAPITKLCIDCHEMGDVMEEEYVHGAMKKNGCIGCHDSHGSGFPQQLKDNLVPLCYQCHPLMKKNRTDHPINKHPAEGRPLPINKDEMLTCANCHNPHASAAPNLLLEENVMELCVRCHPMGR